MSANPAPRQIVNSVDLPTSCQRCFQTLITPSEITQWWHCSAAIVIAKLGGIWVARWGNQDEPDYVVAATIVQYDPANTLKLARFQYFSQSGPLPFEADLPVEFAIEPDGDSCKLTVTQTGFPSDARADEHYNGCLQGWTDTLSSMQTLLNQR